METKSKHPPIILVQTWISLIKSSESEDVRNRATKMLLGAFDDLKTATEFCIQHDIK